MQFTPPSLPGMPPPLPAAPKTLKQQLGGPLMLLLSGLLMLSVAGLHEEQWVQTQPWSEALFFQGDLLGIEGERRVYFRELSIEQRPELQEQVAMLSEMFPAEEEQEFARDMLKPETLLAVQVSEAELAALTVAGRAPAAGQFEVLAGDQASDAAFEIDGRRFEVVGRSNQQAGGLFYTYLLPATPELIAAHFEGKDGVKTGWMHPEGLQHLDKIARAGRGEPLAAAEPEWRAMEESNTAAVAPAPEKADLEIFNGRARTGGIYAFAAYFALILTAAAGSLFFIRLFAAWSRHHDILVQPVFIESVLRPRLFLGTHVALYGVFFGCMAMGLLQPLMNYHAVNYVSMIFSEGGGLEYVGDAYASGNILRATSATFINNFVHQTLGLTFGISVVPLALGALKTAFSFSIVGFAMAPIWVGTASGYAFHALTMVLELEGYIIASFCVIVWPLRLIQAARTASEGALMAGLRVFIGGMVLSGIILFIAALYEAASLILLG